MLRKIPPTHPAYREEEIPFRRGWASIATRETREGWPLLTGEIDENRDSKSTNERGSFVGWFVGLVDAGTRDFYPALNALINPVQNILFLIVHYFNLCVPIAQQPGQATFQGRLSLVATRGTPFVSPPTHLYLRWFVPP
jgi:hypothetical protein